MTDNWRLLFPGYGRDRNAPFTALEQPSLDGDILGGHTKLHTKGLPPTARAQLSSRVCKAADGAQHMFRRTVDIPALPNLLDGSRTERSCGYRQLDIPDWGGNWIYTAPGWQFKSAI